LGVEQLERRDLLAAAALDNTFDTDGRVVTDIAGSTDEARSLAVQTDGKVLVAGQAYINGQYDFAVVRYLADGAIDTTFGNGGRATASISTSDDYGFDVALQSDGKILVTGMTYSGGAAGFDMGVVRLNVDGSLDNTFGTGGKLVINAGSSWDEAYTIAVQADGKILVGGAGLGDAVVLRLNADGTADNSFDGDGRAVVSFGFGVDHAYQIIVQANGKIVVGGGNDQDFAVARLNADGSFDTTFDGDGKVTTSIGSMRDKALGLVVLDDGRIVLAGWTQKAVTSFDLALVRYNVDGSLDSSFGTGGIVTTQVGALNDLSLGATVDDSGRIVVAARSSYDALVAWYGNNGQQLASFTDRGGSGAPVGPADVSVLDDGSILVAGSVGGGATTNFGIMRLVVDENAVGGLDLSTGSITLSGNSVQVTGTSGNDNVMLAFMSPTQFWVSVGGQMQVFTTNQVQSIVIDTRGGNDSIQVMLPAGIAHSVVNGTSSLQITGGPITVVASNLENTLIYGDGDDVAFFIDSSANDVFYTLPNAAIMYGGGSYDQVSGFAQVYGYSFNGGVDVALMYDSVQSDVFYGMEGTSLMIGGGYFNQVVGFDQMFANSSGGGDAAMLYGSTGNDVFYGLPTFSALVSNGQFNQVANFAAVYSFATNNDSAIFYDSVGDDVFYGMPTSSILSGSGFFNQVVGFGAASAYGSAGGNDLAFLFADAGGGQLIASGSAIGLATYLSHLNVFDFDHVQATNSSAQNGDSQLGAVDFALEMVGGWNG